MFTRLTLQRLTRGLLATLLFTLLHPVFAIGLAKPGGPGDGMQVCTGFGMVWMRVDGKAVPARSDVSPSATGVEGDSLPASGGTPAPHCPLCVGAAVASAGPVAAALPWRWPALAQLASPSPESLAPASARVILDAPTRGPPYHARIG